MDANGPPIAAKLIRVFLLDGNAVVRRGVRDVLETEGGITVVGEASSCSQALTRIPALRPDVAVLELRLPDGNGVNVCRELRSRRPELACLVLTSVDEDEALLDSVMAGAAGYALKQIKGLDLVGAVRTVASGQSTLDPATTARLMSHLRHQPDALAAAEFLAGVTERELTVLELVGEGLTNRQIGQRLSLAEETVRSSVSRILVDLGIERRIQAR